MSRATVELDFFGLEKEKSSSTTTTTTSSKSLDRRRSFRGIQSTISRINPELLRSVIASTSSVPPTPKVERNALPPLPVYVPVMRPANAAEIDSNDTAPLTIFYNGTVNVFNVSPEKAADILKLAAEASSKITEPEKKTTGAAPSSDQEELLCTLGGDLPLFRRKSLQRFLEKRKERLTSLSPYACHSFGGRGFGKETEAGNKFGI